MHQNRVASWCLSQLFNPFHGHLQHRSHLLQWTGLHRWRLALSFLQRPRTALANLNCLDFAGLFLKIMLQNQIDEHRALRSLNLPEWTKGVLPHRNKCSFWHTCPSDAVISMEELRTRSKLSRMQVSDPELVPEVVLLIFSSLLC